MRAEEWLLRYFGAPRHRPLPRGTAEIDINPEDLILYAEYAVNEKTIELPTGSYKMVGYYQRQGSTATVYLRKLKHFTTERKS